MPPYSSASRRDGRRSAVIFGGAAGPILEVLHGYMMFDDGRFDDWLVAPALIDEELSDWASDRLRYAGKVLRVQWLNEAASRHVRKSVLQLDSAEDP